MKHFACVLCVLSLAATALADLNAGLRCALLIGSDRPSANLAALDESGRGNHLAIGEAKLSANRDAVTFSGGSRSYIHHGNDRERLDVLNFRGDPFLISADVTLNDNSGGVLLNYANSDASQRALILYHDEGTGTFRALIENQSGSTITAGVAVTVGEPFTVLVWYDGSTLTVEVDGVTNTNTVTGPVQEITTSGVIPQFGRRFDGIPSEHGEMTLSRFLVWRGRIPDATERAAIAGGWRPYGIPRTPKRIVLQGGQSNAVGVQAAASLSDATRSETPIRGALLMDGRAANTSSRGFREGIAGFGETGSYGPEVALCQELGPDYIIGRYCENGTTVANQWLPPNGTTYIAAAAWYREVINETLRAGFPIESVGLLNHRGEGDSGNATDAAAYGANYTALRTALRDLIGRPVYDVHVQLAPALDGHAFYADNIATTRAQIAALVAADPNTSRLVNTDSAQVIGAGNTNHYDADSIDKIGRDSALAIKDVASLFSAGYLVKRFDPLASQAALVGLNDTSTADILAALGTTGGLDSRLDELDIGADNAGDAKTAAEAVQARIEGVTTAGQALAQSSELASIGAGATLDPVGVPDSQAWIDDPRRKTIRAGTVEVGAEFDGTLGFVPHLYQRVALRTLTSVTIDDSATGVTNLRLSADGVQALFDPPDLTAGSYEVRAVMTTTDGQPITRTGRLIVR